MQQINHLKIIPDMKKLFLPFLLFTFLTTAFAQQQVKTYYYTDQDDMYVTFFNAVSDNGRYVLGTHPTLHYIFYLDLQSGEITNIEYDGETIGNDISDDGTIVGSFADPTAFVYDKTGKKVICTVPGIYKNGEWKALEKIEGADINPNGFSGNATCITPDGKLIGGYLPSVANSYRYIPVLWDENGKIIKQFPTTDKRAGGKISSISNDGSIACGWMEDSMYGQVAIWKNGELVDLPMGTGSAQNVTPNGLFVGGQYIKTDGETDQYACIWSEKTGLVEIEHPEDDYKFGQVTGISDNGRIIVGNNYPKKGRSTFKPFIIVDDKFYNFDEYMNDNYDIQGPDGFSFFTPTAMSPDGKVICGYSLIDNARSPWVVAFSEPESIENADAQTVKVTMNAASDEIRIEGEYTSANIFNQTGVCVASDATAAGIINISNLPKGIYFVKVADGKNTVTHKIAK